MNWIRTADQSPEIDQKVIVTDGEDVSVGTLMIMNYGDPPVWVGEEGIFMRVPPVAWIPMPLLTDNKHVS